MKDINPKSALTLDLKNQESVIERGLQGFTDIGLALERIRDGKLYRQGYATFEAYCQARWNLTRQAVNRLIAAATITEAMGCVLEAMEPIGSNLLPATESQARELVGLTPSEAVEVMREAAEATNGKLTAGAIRDARQAQELPDWYCQGGGHDVGGLTPAEEVGSRTCCPDCADSWRDAEAVIDSDGALYAPPTPKPAPTPVWTEEELALRAEMENGGTVVVSLRGLHANLIAWAETEGLYVRIDRRTDWGNPFEMPGDGDRDTVIANYRDHYLPHKPSLLNRIGDLGGKALGCWCAPEACHGDVLKGMGS